MKGLLWVFFEKIGVTVLSLIATFWYANLLGPVGFGLAIIILSTSLFISTIIENLQQYPLIAATENVDDTFKTSAIGWLLVSTLIAIILFMVLLVIYGSDWWLLILLSVVYIPISSISRVYIADLIIKQKYKQLAFRACWGKAAGVAAGLFVAYLGYVELAIILQSFVAVFIALIVMALSNKSLFNSNSRFSLSLFITLCHEGIPSGFAVIEQNAKSHGLIIFLGAFIGPYVSGLYALAIKVVDIPRTLIGLGFTTWATGKFHQVRAQQTRLVSVFNTALLCCCSILVPSYIGLVAVAEPLINEFFGDDWLEASEIIAWLAFYQCIFSFYLYLPPLQVLFKTTYRTLLVNVLSTVIVLLSVVLFSDSFGKYAPLVGMYTSLLFILPKYSVEIVKALNTNFVSIIKVIYGILLSAVVMYGVVYISIDSFAVSNVYMLIAIGVISYIIVFILFNLANIIDRKILANIKTL
ncbi:oligosaccharide flippase family protein [Pseudoalteromonas mariniglutinosa]|uniref:oligosaccharide flippase family protein n=1 Tax=Pseudoalteromonas mariniglutinosa TaxID=206042 RepID=UPI00384E438C